MKHLMYEESYKDRKIRSRTKRTKAQLPHPNGTIVWNECLMRSETKVGRIRIGDAHRQGGKNIKKFLQ